MKQDRNRLPSYANALRRTLGIEIARPRDRSCGSSISTPSAFAGLWGTDWKIPRFWRFVRRITSQFLLSAWGNLDSGRIITKAEGDPYREERSGFQNELLVLAGARIC